MAQSKKPRKAYKPKYARFQQRVAIGDLLTKRSVETAILNDSGTLLDATQQRDLIISFGMAVDRFVKGKGDEDGIHNIACMCNHALVLAELGYGKEHLPTIQDALDGVWRAKLRGEEPGNVGKYGFDGPGLTRLKDVYDIHAAQLEVANHGDLFIASQEVHRRLVTVAKEQKQARALNVALQVENNVVAALEQMAA